MSELNNEQLTEESKLSEPNGDIALIGDAEDHMESEFNTELDSSERNGDQNPERKEQHKAMDGNGLRTLSYKQQIKELSHLKLVLECVELLGKTHHILAVPGTILRVASNLFPLQSLMAFPVPQEHGIAGLKDVNIDVKVHSDAENVAG